MEEVYFMHRIRHRLADGVWGWDKGIEVKDSGTSQENDAAAKQSYHAYLGAYAYGHDPNTDYVSCYITDTAGNRVLWEKWDVRPRPEPEQLEEPEEPDVNE